MAQAYDCFNEELGSAMRRTVVIDKQGNVSAVFDIGGLGETPQKQAYDAALANLA